MPLDFTVIVTVRNRFGDSNQDDFGQETEAPFVGQQKDFSFACPNVDRTQQAVLLFQSQGANVPQSMEINGRIVFGGIPASVEFAPLPFLSSSGNVQSRPIAQWSGNVMLVEPGVLQDNNVLRVRAGKIGDSSNIDNFIIDNVVIVFKTRQLGPLPGTTGGPGTTATPK